MRCDGRNTKSFASVAVRIYVGHGVTFTGRFPRVGCVQKVYGRSLLRLVLAFERHGNGQGQVHRAKASIDIAPPPRSNPRSPRARPAFSRRWARRLNRRNGTQPRSSQPRSSSIRVATAARVVPATVRARVVGRTCPGRLAPPAVLPSRGRFPRVN